MKQHITINQLNSLSPKAKERLREWWKPEDHDIFCAQDESFVVIQPDVDYGYQFDKEKKEFSFMEDRTIKWRKNPAYPLLSIGQMIQFLDERVSHLSLMKNQQKGMNEWMVSYVNFIFKSDELCDALWEGVKSTLERVK